MLLYTDNYSRVVPSFLGHAMYSLLRAAKTLRTKETAVRLALLFLFYFYSSLLFIYFKRYISNERLNRMTIVDWRILLFYSLPLFISYTSEEVVACELISCRIRRRRFLTAVRCLDTRGT